MKVFAVLSKKNVDPPLPPFLFFVIVFFFEILANRRPHIIAAGLLTCR